MKRIFLLLFSVSISSAVNLKAQDASKDFTDGQKAYVLSKFCTEVKYNYVFYNNLTFDWDSLCLATLPKLLATKSKEEYVRELQRLSIELQDGHTYVYEANSDNNLVFPCSISECLFFTGTKERNTLVGNPFKPI